MIARCPPVRGILVCLALVYFGGAAVRSRRRTLVVIRFPWIGFGLGGYERRKFASSVAVTRSTTALMTRSWCYGGKWDEPAQQHYPDNFMVGCTLSRHVPDNERNEPGPHGKSGPRHFILLSVVRYPLVLFMSRGFVTVFFFFRWRRRHSGNMSIYQMADGFLSVASKSGGFSERSQGFLPSFAS